MLESYPRLKSFLLILFRLYVVYISYKCNINQHILIQITVALIAFFFSTWYLAYYFLFHTILKVPCTMPFGSSSVMV